MRHKIALLVLISSLSGAALGSSFVPIFVPDDSDMSPILFDGDGNYAYVISRSLGDDADGNEIIEGTLYHNGGPYVRFGPNEDFTHLYGFDVAGPKVIFSAKTKFIETPNRCGGYQAIFNGPNPRICPPYLPPFVILQQGLPSPIANNKGDFVSINRFQLDSTKVYSPENAFFLTPDLWVTPVWSAAVGTGELLDSGKLATFYGECLRTYGRGPLHSPESNPYRGDLELETESCFGSLIADSSIHSSVINSRTGAMAFCVQGVGFSGNIYLVTPGGSPILVREDVPYCDVLGSDASGNIAYQGGFREFYWSNNPGRPALAQGHAFGGEILRNFRGNSIATSDGVIITGATLGDQFGLFFSNGDTDFPPDPNDPPDDEVIWTNANGGRFGEASNWDTDAVPNFEQVAVFNNSASYAVEFDDSVQQALRLKVESGDVAFVTGSLSLLEDSVSRPGLDVVTGARLEVETGHALHANFATVGSSTTPNASPGELGVFGSTFGTAGRLIIGDLGSGRMILSDGSIVGNGSTRIGNQVGSIGVATVESPIAPNGQTSEWDTGNVAVGYQGQGTLLILDESYVDSDAAYLGYLSGSQGTAEVETGTWEVASLIVGRGGEGLLTITSGGEVNSADFVDVDGSVRVESAAGDSNLPGSVKPSRLKALGDINVGHIKDGELAVVDGAQIQARRLSLGIVAGSKGTVDVRGGFNSVFPSRIIVDERIAVGAGGVGSLTIGAGSSVFSLDGHIGVDTGSVGEVIVEPDGDWQLTGDLTVGSSYTGAQSSICEGDEVALGRGSLIVNQDGLGPSVTGPSLTIGGLGSRFSGVGAVDFDLIDVKPCSAVAPGNSPGTLTLNGDLDFKGAILEVEMMGLGDGQYDVLQVTGDADLSGGIVKFIFDGFLPKQGDQITFLETGGTLTLNDNMRYEYQGANDGFEFEVTTDAEGNITFTANNDAIDLLFGSGFEE